MVKYMRVKPDEGNCVVSHPLTQQFVAPDRGKRYRSDDPLVEAHPWLFISEEELAEDSPVEQATANPGERRSIRRPRQ